MSQVLHRAFECTLHVRADGDGRTLEGPLLPWGVEARVYDRGRIVVETFERGALVDVDPGRVPLTATHPRDAGTLPIGVTLSLDERADAAWGSWRVSKTALGDEVLALAADGVPLGLSVGFMEVAGGRRWSPDRRRVTRTRAALDHVAVVRRAAYVGAEVAAVRSATDTRAAAAHPCRADDATVAVSKRYWSGDPQPGQTRGCLSCRRPIVYGDRCNDCQKRLRLRKRRKLHR